MKVNHTLKILIYGKGEKAVSVVFTFTTQGASLPFWELYDGLLNQTYILGTHQETVREWLRGVHAMVLKGGRFKTQSFYGRNKTMRFTYHHRPELSFLSRLSFGRSWTWNRIVKIDN